MLIDNVTLVVHAGDGGNGVATFNKSTGKAKGGPDGGNGGRGGDVFLQGSQNENDLREFRFKKAIRGEDAGHGTKHNGFGKNGKPIIYFVPLGTKVTNLDTGETFEINTVDKPVLLAKGGKGGFGNVKFKSAINQAPTYRELGEKGETKNIHLELRLIAEIGLIGLPNAGKSSLLRALTNASPKIGNYPFTTLEPSIGMLGKHPLADIPGLIEGASQGVGLGLQFLKHIEKTKILVHCIDVTHENPLTAYETVRKEFNAYNPKLLEKPEIVFINKCDLVDHETAEAVQKLFNQKTFAGSTHDEKSMKKFKGVLMDFLHEI